MGSNARSNTLAKYATEFSIISIVAIFVAGLVMPKGLNWFFVMFFMICFIALIGWLRTGRLSGIFINERNLMSLSRFQLVLWTLIVLSAFLTIALARVSESVADPGSITDPLAIALPEQLWTLLGISTASLVGSPLILSTKLTKEPTTPEEKAFIAKKVAKFDRENAETIAANFVGIKREKMRDVNFAERIVENTTLDAELKTLAKGQTGNEDTAKMLALEKQRKEIVARVKRIGADAERNGTLNFNEDVKDASFSDLFKGDEKANSDHIDMAKVQMFFFTLIIAFSYMVLLVTLIMTEDAAELSSFPELSDGLVALLGISTAGYLTNKPVDKTKTKPKP
jgi:hypothetical protein